MRPNVTYQLHKTKPQAAASFKKAYVDDDSGFQLGQAVQHAKFGQGVVTGIEGSGAHTRVQVNFQEHGSKWLVIAYANLQKG